MDLQAELMAKIKKFEDVKNQLAAISKQIGGLTEQQRVIYNQGLELKGSIDVLTELQVKEKAALTDSKTASLILPEGVKPVVSDTPAPVVAKEEKKTPLEVI